MVGSPLALRLQGGQPGEFLTPDDLELLVGPQLLVVLQLLDLLVELHVVVLQQLELLEELHVVVRQLLELRLVDLLKNNS